jgi:hypothetical protein
LLDFAGFVIEMSLIKTSKGLLVPRTHVLVISPTTKISDGTSSENRIIPRNAERVRGEKMTWKYDDLYFIVYKDHKI